MGGYPALRGLLWTLVSVLFGQAQEYERSSGTGATHDCSHILPLSHEGASGVYYVQPQEFPYQFKVYCLFGSSGTWTVIQKRTGGAVKFNRNWAAYKNGFGFTDWDHWLGLEKISALTSDTSRRFKLRVDLWDFEGGYAYAEYEDFRVGRESTNYRLSVGRYRGTAGDAIRGAYPGIDQNGFGFSTPDRDNDGCDTCIFEGDIAVAECTVMKGGGWWYSRCGSAGLNGDYHPKGNNMGWSSGLHWLTWKGPWSYSVSSTRMMVTPML